MGFLHGYPDADLRAGKCPIAVIGGERSGFVAGKFMYELAPYLPPNSPMSVIANSDHHIMADQPLKLVETIKAQLGMWK
jgi:pimeloyl-ACP methyl ester carboxylesterase